MIVILLHIFLAIGLYYLGRKRVLHLAGSARPYSLPRYYGIYLVVSTFIPLLIALYGCQGIKCDQVHLTDRFTLYPVMVFCFALAGFIYGWHSMHPRFEALKKLERLIKIGLFSLASLTVIVTFAIVLSMIFESLRFFQHVPVLDFLGGSKWLPYSPTLSEKGSFGALPLFAGTFLITFLALMVAVPLGLFTAIYLSYYAHKQFREAVKPILEILAGIPTVIYGFFAVIAVSPLLTFLGTSIGLDVSSENALGAGLVMGIMILPYISSLSDDVLNSVPNALKEGSLGMGATLSETIKYVLLPAASPGIIAAILLATSRAIGETMLVVMAVGLTANFSLNPLDSVTTVTVQIVSLLTGDQSFDSPAPLSAFALGLTLFTMTLGLNMIALKVVRSYREKYDF